MVRAALCVVIALLSAGGSAAQSFMHYLPIEEARETIRSGRSPEERFYGYYSAHRHFFTSGVWDSTEWAEREMVALASRRGSDSLLCDAYLAIGNRHLLQEEYDNALRYTLEGKALTRDPLRLYRATLNTAGIYLWSGLTGQAVAYLEKLEAMERVARYDLQRDLFRGLAYSRLGKPDSALLFLGRIEADHQARPDEYYYTVALAVTANAHALRGDGELADLFFRRALARAEEQGKSPLLLPIGNRYGQWLLARGRFAEARALASRHLEAATATRNFRSLADAASLLYRVEDSLGNAAAALRYARLRMAYQDSLARYDQTAELVHIVSGQKLDEIQEEAEREREESLRRQSLQMALLGLGILGFLMLFLLFGLHLPVGERTIRFLGVLGLLVLFEFLNLLIHPALGHVTHHEPWLMLAGLVVVAALLVPLHHFLEARALHRLLEKNRLLRLERARRTLEQAEGRESSSSNP